ncbi:hypothetical protein C0991_000471, partial [Blastosporella zonata]
WGAVTQFTRNKSSLGEMLREVLREVLREIINPLPIPRYNGYYQPPYVNYRAITRVAPSLINLRALHIVWIPGQTKASCYYRGNRLYAFCPLLEELLPIFGRSLRSVSLHIHASVTLKLASHAKDFGHLEEINLKYQDKGPAIGNSFASITSLLPLINGSSHSLKALSIEVEERTAELPQFIKGMQKFPLLRKLSLIMPLGPELIPDPSALNGLLSHPLHELNLRFQHGPNTAHPPSHQLSHWYKQCLQGLSFDTVETLQFGPFSPDFPVPGPLQSPFQIPFQYVTSLTIADIYLSLEDISMLASNGRLLRKLSLIVGALCLEVIDALAPSRRRRTTSNIFAPDYDVFDKSYVYFHETWRLSKQYDAYLTKMWEQDFE